MLKNTSIKYGKIAKLFHWLMAVLFIAMFSVAYIMINIPRSDFMFTLYNLHKATGMLILGLAALRLGWRFVNPQPKMNNVPTWQQFAANVNIFVLYALMFLMPMTGILTSTLGGHDISFYGLFIISPLGHSEYLSHWFGQAHEWLSYLLIALFSLHVLAAFYHHYFLRDNVLRRMLFVRGD